MSKLLKSMRDIIRSPWAILIVVVIIVLFLIQYSSFKGNSILGMADKKLKTAGGNVAQTQPSQSDGNFEQNLGRKAFWAVLNQISKVP